MHAECAGGFDFNPRGPMAKLKYRCFGMRHGYKLTAGYREAAEDPNDACTVDAEETVVNGTTVRPCDGYPVLDASDKDQRMPSIDVDCYKHWKSLEEGSTESCGQAGADACGVQNDLGSVATSGTVG